MAKDSQAALARKQLVKDYCAKPANADLEAAMDKAGVAGFGRAAVRSREAEFGKLDDTRRAAVLDQIKGKTDSQIQRELGGLIKKGAQETRIISEGSARARAMLDDLPVTDVRRIDAAEANKRYVANPAIMSLLIQKARMFGSLKQPQMPNLYGFTWMKLSQRGVSFC